MIILESACGPFIRLLRFKLDGNQTRQKVLLKFGFSTPEVEITLSSYNWVHFVGSLSQSRHLLRVFLIIEIY